MVEKQIGMAFLVVVVIQGYKNKKKLIYQPIKYHQSYPLWVINQHSAQWLQNGSV